MRRNSRFRRPVPDGEPIFYKGSDLQVLGTQSTRKGTTMRLVGTGKAPESLYVKGQVFDMPDGDPEGHAQDLIDRGWAEEVDAADDPARTPLQIANSIVRGDPLTDPADQKVAATMISDTGDDSQARAIVHSQDPDADPSFLDEVAGDRHSPATVHSKVYSYADGSPSDVLTQGRADSEKRTDKPAAAPKASTPAK